jgi:type VI secretion system protein ImpD
MNPHSAEHVPSPNGATRDALPASPVPAAAPRPSLLDLVLDATADRRPEADTNLDQFLGEPSPGQALAHWLGPLPALRGEHLKQYVAQRLSRDIARLDALLNRQVNAILHHPSFQKLEASWRGLYYLVEQVPDGQNVKVRMLNLSWRELARDLERAIEFDQSQLFKKVYGDEFGHPGGEPFGVLLGDYEIHHRPQPDHPVDDLAALQAIAGVAAAAFAPFITGVHPSTLDLTSFVALERPLNLPRTFEQLEYLKWRALRQVEDARFVGLTMPRVLMRPPYTDNSFRVDGFRFREEVDAPSRQGYLWGTAVYAFGAVLARTFAQSGWLAAIRGARRGVEAGGVVTGLPTHCFSTDRTGIALKCSTDVIITDVLEKELGDLGFIPLCHGQDTELAVFYGNQSLQKPQKYDEPAATVNATLSAMLQYMLCVSRVAHYVKVITRDRLGSFSGPAECEEYLRRWLANYITSNDGAGEDVKARYPLREARVRVRESPERPGSYLCVFHLRPHYQLDQLNAAVRLVTTLSPGQPG